MDIALVKKTITIEENIGCEHGQIMIEGDIIVPDINPDIAMILESDAKVTIEKIEILKDRVNYIGTLDVQVLYLAKGSDKPIHSMTTSMVIDELITLNGVDDTMWVEVVPTIQNIDYKILNDRKISLKSIINVEVSGEEQHSIELITDAENLKPTQVKKNKININKTIDNKNDRFMVKEELQVGNGSPNIKNILQRDARIINKEVRTGNGKVVVDGEILVSILYKGDSDESIVEIIEKEVGFSGSIDVSGANEDMHSMCDLKVAEFYTTIKEDDDGEDRLVDIEISVSAHVKVNSEESMEILDDAYVIGKDLLLEKKEIKYPQLICRNRNQSTIKEIIQIEGPDVLQIFKVSGDALIDDVVVMDDRIITEGIVNVNILYITQSDDAPICSHKEILPFRQVIETRGAKPHMDKKVAGNVEHIGFNMQSDKEVELRIQVSFTGEVIEYNKQNVVVDVEVADLPKDVIEKMASMVIYVVQKNDTLWSIAKKFNTDIDDIVEINEMENPDLLFEGQKLLILKKILIN